MKKKLVLSLICLSSALVFLPQGRPAFSYGEPDITEKEATEKAKEKLDEITAKKGIPSNAEIYGFNAQFFKDGDYRFPENSAIANIDNIDNPRTKPEKPTIITKEEAAKHMGNGYWKVSMYPGMAKPAEGQGSFFFTIDGSTGDAAGPFLNVPISNGQGSAASECKDCNNQKSEEEEEEPEEGEQ